MKINTKGFFCAVAVGILLFTACTEIVVITGECDYSATKVTDIITHDKFSCTSKADAEYAHPEQHDQADGLEK